MWVSVLEQNGLDTSEVDEFLETVLKPRINLRVEQDPDECLTEALKCIEAIFKNGSYAEHNVILYKSVCCNTAS